MSLPKKAQDPKRAQRGVKGFMYETGMKCKTQRERSRRIFFFLSQAVICSY